MNLRNSVPLIAAAAMAALVACDQPTAAVETKTQMTTTGPQGKVVTSQETRRVGSTVESKIETKSRTDDGMVKVQAETYVGTVTVYEAGKKIEVLTGESTRHAFDLDTRSLLVSVAGTVAVGSRVRLEAQKGSDGAWNSVAVAALP